MSENQANSTQNKKQFFSRASAADFKKIPGSPIAYWVSEKVWAIFGESKMLDEIASPKIGMRTGDNERFMRYWYEAVNQKLFRRNHRQGGRFE